MDVFRLTYYVGLDSRPHELLLDVLGRRWTARAVVQTVIKHEFPGAPLPSMPAGDWTMDHVLEEVGIHDLTCTYVNQFGPDWTGYVTDNGIVICADVTCSPISAIKRP